MDIFGLIVALVILYFVIRAAVRDGINESALVSKSVRKQINDNLYEEMMFPSTKKDKQS